jgi:DNA helicase II / ATP-dependent DNA helicase PcrA
MINEHGTGAAEGIGRRDHARSSEHWIVGPPGTGKTTATSAQVRCAANKYGSSSVLVTSFSRAGAAELADCDLPIPPENLGTLHSECFHALGKPQIAEAHVAEWNRTHPFLAITPVRSHARLDGEDSVEDALDIAHGGDSLLLDLNRYRGLMLDPDLWPTAVRQFAREWAHYKRERQLLDFTDLIETCLQDLVFTPRNPSVIFVDEAQDLNAMQLKLIRRWGERAQYSVLAFDDDQTIYSFMGASPEAILDGNVPETHKIILRQSHRVPRAVHELAEALIRRVSRRQEKVHDPRPAPGEVRHLSGTYKAPEYAILSSAMKHLESGRTVMFLASCSYMLRPLIEVLRKKAIPFHNPYRTYNGLWNPLRLGSKSVLRRLLALLVAHPQYGEGQQQWRLGDVRLWAEYLPAGVLKPHALDLFARADTGEPVTKDRLAEILEAEPLASLLIALESAWLALLEWWLNRVAPEYRNRIQFPASVIEQHGMTALVDEPKVVVGTIHSVKGGEADVVYIFPDLSRAAADRYQVAGAARDSVIRVFYVGTTRARETLYICQPAGPTAMCF